MIKMKMIMLLIGIGEGFEWVFLLFCLIQGIGRIRQRR